MSESESLLDGSEMSQAGNMDYPKSILLVFFSPREVFVWLRNESRWLVPFVLIVLVSFGYQIATSKYHMNDLKSSIRADKTLSAEETERRIENIDSQKTSGISARQIGLALGALTVLKGAQIFGLALILWMALHLSYSEATYLGLLSLSSYVGLVAIPEAIIKIPLVMAKGSTAVYLGLAAVLPPEWTDSPLFNLCKKIDIFSVYQIVLLVIGLTVIANIPRKKAIWTVGYLWAIWLILALLFGGLIRVV